MRGRCEEPESLRGMERQARPRQARRRHRDRRRRGRLSCPAGRREAAQGRTRQSPRRVPTYPRHRSPSRSARDPRRVAATPGATAMRVCGWRVRGGSLGFCEGCLPSCCPPPRRRSRRNAGVAPAPERAYERVAGDLLGVLAERFDSHMYCGQAVSLHGRLRPPTRFLTSSPA